jgi:hypothetical protein
VFECSIAARLARSTSARIVHHHHPRRTDDPETPDTGEGSPPLTDIGVCEFAGGTSGVADGDPAGAADRSGLGPLRLAIAPNPNADRVSAWFQLPEAETVAIGEGAGRPEDRPRPRYCGRTADSEWDLLAPDPDRKGKVVV